MAPLDIALKFCVHRVDFTQIITVRSPQKYEQTNMLMKWMQGSRTRVDQLGFPPQADNLSLSTINSIITSEMENLSMKRNCGTAEMERNS